MRFAFPGPAGYICFSLPGSASEVFPVCGNVCKARRRERSDRIGIKKEKKLVSEPDKNRSPWLRIPAVDYEGHMGPGGTDQLSPLDNVLGEVYGEIKPERLLVLGCGTGNGFRHVDPAVTKRVVGVDINSAYIEIARDRYTGLKDSLELCCYYAEKCTFGTESFDMIHSALLLEYLDPETMVQRIASWLMPGGTASFVIQEPSGNDGPVSKTEFKSLQLLGGIMRLMSPEVLGRLAARNGLREKRSRKIPLKGKKQFHMALFVKEEKDKEETK